MKDSSLRLRVASLDDELEKLAKPIVVLKFLCWPSGQGEHEAYKLAQRIFRGGDVRGKIAFTKDSA